MIVDPDFPDHWKTRMLVDLLGGDEAAPVYLIRLWAHCQNRKAWEFEIPTAAMRGLCRFPGDPLDLETALINSGFIERNGGVIKVCGWDDYNASLIANWENGKRGGRPKKKPMGNPSETHGEPTANPSETDKRREEKIREDSFKADGSKINQIALRISELVPKWSPHLNGDELAALHDNAVKWENLTEDDWLLLTRWYQEKSSVAEFRFQKKAKLIREVDEELDRASRALKWKAAASSQAPPANWREIGNRVLDRSMDGLEYSDLKHGEKLAIADAIRNA